MVGFHLFVCLGGGRMHATYPLPLAPTSKRTQICDVELKYRSIANYKLRDKNMVLNISSILKPFRFAALIYHIQELFKSRKYLDLYVLGWLKIFHKWIATFATISMLELFEVHNLFYLYGKRFFIKPSDTQCKHLDGVRLNMKYFGESICFWPEKGVSAQEY